MVKINKLTIRANPGNGPQSCKQVLVVEGLSCAKETALVKWLVNTAGPGGFMVKSHYNFQISCKQSAEKTCNQIFLCCPRSQISLQVSIISRVHATL